MKTTTKVPEDAVVLGRRQFFRKFAGETLSMVDELKGIPQLRLSDLPDFPPDKLRRLRPMLAAGLEVVSGEDGLWVITPSDSKRIHLGEASPITEQVLARIRVGTETIGQVATDLCTAFRITEDEAYSAVRGLFLYLVQQNLCFPANSIEP